MKRYGPVMVSLPDLSNTFTSGLSGKLRKKMHVLGDKIQSLNENIVSRSLHHSKSGASLNFVTQTPDTLNRDTITAAYNFSESITATSQREPNWSSLFEQGSSSQDQHKETRIRSHFGSISSSSSKPKKREKRLDMMLSSPSCSKYDKCTFEQVNGLPELPPQSTPKGKATEENETSKVVCRRSRDSETFSLSLCSDQEEFCLVLDEHITV